jgi:hypothetical protein
MRNKRDGAPSGQKVFVYFNLHKKLWSVRSLEGSQKGLVIAHAKRVQLRNVTPKVSKAGRERVIKEGRKNVHAGLVGTWVPFFTQWGTCHTAPLEDITYNPYLYDSFVYKDGEKEYLSSDVALLLNRRVHVRNFQKG